MKKIVNECCGCATPGYPCRGSACPLAKVEVHYCDKCSDELDEIYDVRGEELCEDCLKKLFRRD